MTSETAIIFVPSTEFDPHATRCITYAEERGYRVVGIVRDNYDAAMAMTRAGRAEVLIVSEEGHLPPRRKPRLEIVAHTASVRYAERTRIIRRVWVR